jgi:hypothetical protein
VILLYIEAKIGSEGYADKLPMYILEEIDDLEEMLKGYHGEQILVSVFKKDVSSTSGCSKYFAAKYASRNIPAYTDSSAASTKAFHKCKAKELRTMTR